MHLITQSDTDGPPLSGTVISNMTLGTFHYLRLHTAPATLDNLNGGVSYRVFLQLVVTELTSVGRRSTSSLNFIRAFCRA